MRPSALPASRYSRGASTRLATWRPASSVSANCRAGYSCGKGARLRITDADGLRLTCFATNTADLPIAALELRHRQRARAEDRIRAARATGVGESAELREARKRIRLLEQENEVLRRAAAYLSQANLPSK